MSGLNFCKGENVEHFSLEREILKLKNNQSSLKNKKVEGTP
jgi:hypothetical protein